MSLKDFYQQTLHNNNYQTDLAQLEIIEHLSSIEAALLTRPSQSSFFERLFKKTPPTVDGLYLYGGVGRGKTFLVDLFFEHLATPRKRRMHFHRFMYETHQALKLLKGKKDPLQQIAKQMAAEIDVLCFDEFYVSDITDAMMLAGLLEPLFINGVTLIATSNAAPDELYKNGLQRNRFLPAIELIHQHCLVHHMQSDTDYRLRLLEQAELYHHPLDQQANDNLAHYFQTLCPDKIHHEPSLTVENREIKTIQHGDGVVWFDCEMICGDGRSQNDYIEIAKCFQTVLIGNVPQMNGEHESMARRFISLVDEFYDHQVKLILSAEVPLEALYQGRLLQFEFQRTKSRLTEMQSHEYLAKRHRV